ncbi:MAG: hypothetical protein AAFV53_27825 [Myxococcota bacterium]
MPYDPSVRNATEKASLKEIQRVLKGKGNIKGVFYAAANGDQASLVAFNMAKDKKGMRTMTAGKAIKKGLAATSIMRGLLVFEGGKLVMSVQSKKGSAVNIKKALIKDLTRRSKPGADHDPPTAKGLLMVIKKVKIVDASGAAEETPDEDAGEAMSREELGALGIDPDETAQLSVLEQHFSDHMSDMSDALAEILRSDETETDLDDALLQKAALAELNELKTRLQGYADMSPENKTKVLQKVEQQITAITTKSSGENPFPDELGAVIPATDAILVEVAQATEDYIVGSRSMGMETEYTKASAYNRAVRQTKCPICNAKAGEDCDASNKTAPFHGKYHKPRSNGHRLADHTPIFYLKRKSDSKVLCQWDFETQGKGERYWGTLEAVTKPWTLKPPKGATAQEARAHQQLISDILEAIDLVQAKRSAVIGLTSLTSAVASSLTNKDGVSFTAAGGLSPQLRFRKGPKRSPQITFSTSLSAFHETCERGFPPGLHSDARMEANNTQLKVAALDGDDFYNAVVAAITAGAPSAHKTALDEGKIGPKLRGFGAVLGAWLTATAMGHSSRPKDPSKPEGWEIGKIMPHPSQVKPPQGATESDEDFLLRLQAAAEEKSFFWMKDQFAIMPKVPMAILAQDGGLRPEELAAINAYRSAVDGVVSKLVARYGLTIDSTVDPDNTGATIKAYLDKVFSGKPPKLKESPTVDEREEHEQLMKTWREDASSDWSDYTGSAEGHEILYRDEDDSLRMVTEIRMCTGTPSSRELAETMTRRMMEMDREIVDEALTKLYG